MVASLHDAALMADSFVSLAAITGIFTAIGTIRSGRAEDPLNRRFLFGLYVLLAMLAARLLTWWTGLTLFNVVTLWAAAAIPLATLLLTEGLMRRHAAGWVKAFFAGGTAIFLAVSLLPDAIAEPWRSWSLLAYQVTSFIIVGATAVRRNRADLSAAENRTVDRIALSLLVILPLLATDFRTSLTFIPVRLGGVAILFLCWLMIGLGRRHFSHRDTLGAFAILVAAAAVAGTLVAFLAIGDGTFTVQAIAMVLSASLVAAIWNDSLSLVAERRRHSLLMHMASGDISGTDRFLDGLQNHSLIEDAIVLKPENLGDFDLDVLQQIFRDHPVLRHTDCNPAGELDEAGRDALGWLLEKYEATHVILAAASPLTLVALNMPSVTATHGAETELRAVQRIAYLISTQEKPGG